MTRSFIEFDVALGVETVSLISSRDNLVGMTFMRFSKSGEVRTFYSGRVRGVRLGSKGSV